MEINITSLLEADQFALSHSRAEGGQDAGPNTWRASLERAEETPLLSTPEELQAMRDFARSSGGWNDEEVNAWTPQEVNALFLQWIAGDCRECPALLEGITFEERGPDEWYYEDESEPGFEYGPFADRSEAYTSHTGNQGHRADSLDEIDWLEYETDANAGRISGNLFKGDDGQIYFYLGN